MPAWQIMQLLLALLTRVLQACFICSRLFLKFCLGKMAECMEFYDYLEAGVHDSVREGTRPASWAKAKMRLEQVQLNTTLGIQGDRRSTSREPRWIHHDRAGATQHYLWGL